LELEAFDAAGWAAVARVLDRFDGRWRDEDNSSQEEDGIDPESEYVFSGGEIQIGRFHSIDLSEKLLEQTSDKQDESKARKVLGVVKSNRHTTLEWKRQDASTEDRVAGNTVQVEVRAFALSPSELQAASGGSLTSTELGFMSSGVVSAAGPHVEKLGVGDRVVVYGAGSAATSIRASEEACFRIRDETTFEEAVKLPLLEYCSALYALETVAELEKGQSILIHRARTAVGKAALEIALERQSGSSDHIFCTVDNSAEAEEIITKLDVASDHIFASGSTTSFLRSVTQATNGQGVDVVLSTFADPSLVAASWKCLTQYGHLIQLVGWEASAEAQRGGDQLHGMNILRESKTFSRVDLAQLLQRRPHALHSHLRRAMTRCRTGNVSISNRDIKTLEAESIKDGIKLPRNPCGSTSPVVVKLPEDVGALRVAPAERRLALRSDRTYIIIGGVGGLGIPCARFLAERGARRLILFSRSAERFAADNPLLHQEFEAMGCSVKFVSGDVAPRNGNGSASESREVEDVEKLVASAETPIGGIIHSAMALRWRDVIDCKVHGTWNLHEAIESQPAAKYRPLDFFDAFVQHRRARGLACSALDIGIMEGVGILARETRRLEALRSVEHHVLHERELLDALELAILNDESFARSGDGNKSKHNKKRQSAPPPTTTGYVSAGQMAIGLGMTASGPGLARQSAWRRDPRMQMGRLASIHNNSDDNDGVKNRKQETTGNGGAQQLADALARNAHEQTAASREALTRVLARELAATVRQLTMRDGNGDSDLEQDAAAPMRSLGVDSLVSVELRGWLRRRAKVSLSVQDVRGVETLADLAGLVTLKIADARMTGEHSSLRQPIAVPV
ncbi:hypothetical protein MAPG_06092, partial [Magnaporthiopsis poae ATCC 64411]